MSRQEQAAARTVLTELRQYLNECDDVYEPMVVFWSDDHPLLKAVSALQEQSDQGRLASPGRGSWQTVCNVMDGLETPGTANWPALVDSFFDALDAFEEWLLKRVGERSEEGVRPAQMGRNRRRGRAQVRGVFLLKALLLQHHSTATDAPNLEPLTEHELAAALGCSQSTISRWMKQVFQGGLAEYKALCKAAPKKGFRIRNRDGTAGVEAIAPEDD